MTANTTSSFNPVTPEHRLALPAGFQLLEYRILKVLGQSPLGITYLADDSSLNSKVMINEFLPVDFATRTDDLRVRPLSRDSEQNFASAKRAFMSETLALLKLSHTNTIRAFRYFELLGTAYFVMELVQGFNFRVWLRHNPQPNEAELRGLLIPLLNGLEHIHRQGFLHRDICPENILIPRDGEPLLLNFGNASGFQNNRQKPTTFVHHGFSAIEQYQWTVPEGPYTDLYALAGVMVYAITGELPPPSVERLGRRDPYRSLAKAYRGKYSARFLQTLDSAFAFRPENRVQTAALWRDRLVRSTLISSPKGLGSKAVIKERSGTGRRRWF
jgi:serine/threonine protein kinase